MEKHSPVLFLDLNGSFPPLFIQRAPYVHYRKQMAYVLAKETVCGDSVSDFGVMQSPHPSLPVSSGRLQLSGQFGHAGGGGLGRHAQRRG